MQSGSKKGFFYFKIKIAFGLCLLSLWLFGCGKADDSVKPISKLREYIFVNRSTPTAAYCYVNYYVSESSNERQEMGDDLLIDCKGERATLEPAGYYAYFDAQPGEEIEIRIQRPSEGTARILKYVIP